MINRTIGVTLVAAVGYLAFALALKAAEKAGYLSHDAVVRAVAVLTGLGLAIYANFLPKDIRSIGTIRNPVVAMRLQSVRRVCGWAFTLGGLAYALTSLAPLPDTVPLVLLGGTFAYALGYTGWAIMECRSIEKRPT